MSQPRESHVIEAFIGRCVFTEAAVRYYSCNLSAACPWEEINDRIKVQFLDLLSQQLVAQQYTIYMHSCYQMQYVARETL